MKASFLLVSIGLILRFKVKGHQTLVGYGCHNSSAMWWLLTFERNHFLSGGGGGGGSGGTVCTLHHYPKLGPGPPNIWARASEFRAIILVEGVLVGVRGGEGRRQTAPGQRSGPPSDTGETPLSCVVVYCPRRHGGGGGSDGRRKGPWTSSPGFPRSPTAGTRVRGMTERMETPDTGMGKKY